MWVHATIGWEAAVQERSPGSRHGTLKLNWSLLLSTWTKKKPSGGKILCSVDTKIYLFGRNEQLYVWWREGEAWNSKNPISTVKHDAGSIIAVGMFSCQWICCSKDSKWNNEDLQSRQENLKPSARRLALGCYWTFQHDNDPNHTSEVVKERLNQARN